ncbi:hypothetical protein [Peribacillus kribbensis]|uniref:hypothetical protein n=1 Tax=Peribacillus kribbensis TaxID=356658 RepID=UPI0003FBC250|nr:hypothetical protein [Peribacillus kribbensis]
MAKQIMRKFTVNFHFDQDQVKTFEMEGRSPELLLNSIITQRPWFFFSNAEVEEAINMTRVTRISINRE